MKFNIKWLLYLPILFFFLPGFSFYLPGLKGIYKFFYISLYFSIVIIFIMDREYFINKLISVCKKTPLIYFIIFLLFIIVNSFVLSLFDISSISHTIRNIILYIILCIIPTIVYFIYIIKKYLGLKKFIKIFMFLFWINLILGFIAYLGRWFDISVINGLFDFFNNSRILDVLHEGTAEQTSEVYFQSKRLCGLYVEPGSLGQMMFIYMPFVYSIASTKIKIYENLLFNKIFKITLIPFTWLTLLLTQSAMSLVFAIIITFIYYFKNILKFFKKYSIFVLSIILLLIMITSRIDFSDTYVARIINVLANVRSFEGFILIEPSLATRVVSYINEFQIFLHHPFTGVGLGNVKNYMYNQYLNSPVPLTPEIITRTKLSFQMGGNAMFNNGFLYMILAENGIFSYFIFMIFYIKIFMDIFKISQKIYKNSFQYLIVKSLLYTLIAIFLFSFYDLTLLSIHLHLIITLCVIYIYTYKKMRGNNTNA